MKITFVIPPSGFLMDERVFPSLGVLKVAAVLEQHGETVDVLDLSGVADVERAIEDYVRTNDHGIDCYGVTATMPQMPSAFKIAKQLRRWTSARLILGGPHATLLQASHRQGVERATKMMRDLLEAFDVVVAGDGEYAIRQAIGENPPALIDADDPKSPLFLNRDDLNKLPLPARHLIDIRSYRYAIDGVPTQSLVAQLGCSFGCNFCGGRRSPFLRRVRTRSTAAVIAEMRHLYETHGTRGFMFLDDELNVNPKLMELLQEIIRLQESLGAEFRLRGLLKSELVTVSMAESMYRAGFRQVLIGFESGSDHMLKNMNKHATRDQNTRCVEILQRAGIRVKALMSLGHPGESYTSVDATEDWLLQVQPADFDVTIITVYPGTPYFDDAVPHHDHFDYVAANGDRLHIQQVDHRQDVNFYKGVPSHYQSFVSTDYLSRKELVDCRDEVEKRVRTRLSIPYPQGSAELQYEHSMGAR